jgi:hypothetical protein
VILVVGNGCHVDVYRGWANDRLVVDMDSMSEGEAVCKLLAIYKLCGVTIIENTDSSCPGLQTG